MNKIYLFVSWLIDNKFSFEYRHAETKTVIKFNDLLLMSSLLRQIRLNYKIINNDIYLYYKDN